MTKPTYTLSKYDRETALAQPRDPKWDEARDKYLKTHHKCVVCGRNTDLQIHHMFPVSYIRELGRPELELDERNFMTLCESDDDSHTENHHLLIGHLDSWKSMNEHVVANAKKFINHTAAQIKANPQWKAEVAKRPRPATALTKAEKEHIIKLMESKFGKKK